MPLRFSSSNPKELGTDFSGQYVQPWSHHRVAKKHFTPKQEGRPSRWKDGLARSFVHGSTTLQKEKSKHLAWWQLGPLSPGVQLKLGAPEAKKLRPTGRCTLECRLKWRFAHLVKRPASRVGGNCWSRGRNIRLLLGSAAVECRPSWAPQISIDILSAHQQ